ncbi:hypothetical protein ACFV0T_03750 [Streptomyces sp. NPDC059582]|uniref:hypothetical protein n=1 Tax=Streptomyces sp. NPDC059582 TaxID=3346875 RepID=UPI0036CCA451
MRGGPGMVWVTVLAALTAVGCGTGENVVVEGTPPATPYGGPLHVPARASEESGARAALAESGAAGRALECDGEIAAGGQGETWSEGDGGDTPEEGLAAYFGMEQPGVPSAGYRVEREEAGRVLFSYDVDGRTKVAVVVAKDGADRPGWGPETTAFCDPAEFPASWTDSHGYEIWTDRDGHRVPTSRVSSSAGEEHCDWQRAHFLELNRDEERRLYARDPDGVLEPGMLTAAYDGDVRLPRDAHDTGYRFEDRRLWLTDDPSTAYVRTSDGVEAWRLVRPDMGCR